MQIWLELPESKKQFHNCGSNNIWQKSEVTMYQVTKKHVENQTHIKLIPDAIALEDRDGIQSIFFHLHVETLEVLW